MNKKLGGRVGIVLLAGALMLVVLSACSGSPKKAAPSPPAPPAPTVSADTLAKGKLLFEKTAGGVGCASCHGLDARGDKAPKILGKSLAEIQAALKNVEKMSFIDLTPAEIEAVSAYLQQLSAQSQDM